MQIQSKICTVLIIISLTFLLGCGQETTTEQPNILWITSEDNSPYLGAYGDSLATTPNLDRLADRGIVYENAFATTPVCAPSRFTLITGTYANVMGTENMRSDFPVPGFIRFFPKYLKDVGYYTTNNSKKDYNTIDQPGAWHESSDSASFVNRNPGQPFFHVRNFTVSHESSLHDPIDTLIHDPEAMNIPPYHPETPEIKTDWAHYYDQITKMDAMVGEILDKLEQSGEADNTIVFYYSDHGGVLPRSKRYMYESGLRVPLIVYFPPKYSHLAPDVERTDRLVSFVDFAPTVLSLAGIDPPDYMHGKAFLGEYADQPKDYVYAYRGRMDERFDLTRGVLDKQYLYTRNFMPHRKYAQPLAYLWRAPSMRSWHQQFLAGNLNDTQKRFFQTKPAEELYQVATDPHNINNLAGDHEYRDVLKRMREVNSSWMRNMLDLGFIPEETIDSLRGDETLYEAVRNQSVPVEEIIETAELASEGNVDNLDLLESKLDHSNSAVRFWAATGFSIVDDTPAQMGEMLLDHTDDPSPAVRIAVAEALYNFDQTSRALDLLEESLNEPQIMVKLRALNTIQALEPDRLPATLTNKVKSLQAEHTDQWGTGYYIRNACAAILDSEW